MLYRIFVDGVKFHWATSLDLANKVAENLETRFKGSPIIELIEDNSKELYWDPGGSLFTDDNSLEFDLGESLVTCWLQHWDLFKSMVLKLESADTSKYDNEFNKLHGYMHVLCLSNEEKVKLVQQVKQNSHKYDSMFDVSNERFNNVHAELNQDGYLISERGQRELQRQKEEMTVFPKETLN